AYNFLLNYYKQTDRLSSAQKEQIFAHAQDVIKNTPSAAELQRKSEEAKLASENAWRKHEAQRAAEWDKLKSEARRNSQKRATTQANDEPFGFDIHSNSGSNSNSSGSAFHLYAEEFPESEDLERQRMQMELEYRILNSASSTTSEPNNTKGNFFGCTNAAALEEAQRNGTLKGAVCGE
ncbi:hypothetical protein L4D76_28335, partial [Photobacterium sagamiensis]|uniref:hypothetical protein n=1 Tax=Photobacterium sagamiensis TaxID=2910241 RepID=UPI003D136CBD